MRASRASRASRADSDDPGRLGDERAEAALLLALAPLSPPPALAVRVQARLRARISGAGIRCADDRAAPAGPDAQPAAVPAPRPVAADWHLLATGSRWKLLHDDGRSFGWLLQMAPGAALPPHAHRDGDEECLVLAGEVRVEGRRLLPGDYHRAPRGSRHADVRTVDGCLLYLRSPSAQLRLMPSGPCSTTR